MNHPMTPEVIPTTVPARSAFTMNGKSKSWVTSRTRSHVSFASVAALTSVLVPVVVVRRRLGLADDDEPSVGRGEHLDAGAVEAAEGLAGDHLVGRADRGAAFAQVHDAIDVAKDRVDVVRHEQDRHALLLADAGDERSDGCLVGQVEAVERLVQQQEPRPAYERLRDEQALLLTARELTDRSS